MALIGGVSVWLFVDDKLVDGVALIGGVSVWLRVEDVDGVEPCKDLGKRPEQTDIYYNQRKEQNRADFRRCNKEEDAAGHDRKNIVNDPPEACDEATAMKPNSLENRRQVPVRCIDTVDTAPDG